MKQILILSACILLISCKFKNSDGSDSETYSSCRIVNSQALLASDRAKDIKQCWDGVDYKEKSKALSWCAAKVSSYIGRNYTFGHTVKYQVASTNCPFSVRFIF